MLPATKSRDAKVSEPPHTYFTRNDVAKAELVLLEEPNPPEGGDAIQLLSRRFR